MKASIAEVLSHVLDCSNAEYEIQEDYDGPAEQCQAEGEPLRVLNPGNF